MTRSGDVPELNALLPVDWYAGERPWHRAGKPLPDRYRPDVADSIKAAFLAGRLAERVAVVEWLKRDGSQQMAGYDHRLASSIASCDHLNRPPVKETKP